MSSGAVRAGAPAAIGIARARRVVSAVRFDEVMILQGTPLLGALFALGPLRRATLPAVALVVAGSCALVAHVFLLNDWAGLDADRRDPHRPRRGTGPAAVSSRTLGHLSVLALLLALLLLGPFGPRTLALTLAIAGLSALYSIGPFPAKGVPVLGSCLHVAGGALHFHLGWSPFAAFDARCLALSAFFGLTFAAGHLMQEVRDHDADRRSGIRTNAVAFGQATAFAVGLGLFALADALLVGMALGRVVRPALALAAPFFVLHLAWSLGTLRAGLTFEGIRRLRGRYRRLYVVIGVLMLAACAG
jgi:4-hydroxybenzoate polyprenyltransferase